METSFYARDTKKVAQELLGKILCRRLPSGQILKSRIVETEAYLGESDPACHTFGGRRTKRTEAMWGPPGRAYIYLIYGMHDCLNFVTKDDRSAEAVLIRALEPVEGHEFWQGHLPHLKENDWMKGPGRLCRALKIDRTLNHVLLCGPEIWVEEAPHIPKSQLGRSPRIGVASAKDAAEWPLRFFIKNSKALSGPKKFNQ